MPRTVLPAGRVPTAELRSLPLRIHAIVPDFELEDVWALPVSGGADEFPRLLEIVDGLDPDRVESGPARLLFDFRRLLGRIFESDQAPGRREAKRLPIPGTAETSLADRLPEDLRRSADGTNPDRGSLLFEDLYRTENEAAAELSNKTVHSVALFVWADRGGGVHQGLMGVYVKPRGRLGRAYMALIKPFRYLVVYPALMRHFGRAWDRRSGGREPERRRAGT